MQTKCEQFALERKLMLLLLSNITRKDNDIQVG